MNAPLPPAAMATMAAAAPTSLEASLWWHTATPAVPAPPLHGAVRTDVLVVGAGYTGLSTALHLAEAGAVVTVLDAYEPGWGASGRNGGQVNPTLKHDPDELLQRFGPEAGERLVQAISSSADLVFHLAHKHAIACDPVRRGWLQLSHVESALEGLRARADKWSARGVPVQWLDRDAVRDRVGTSAFAGGWLDGRAGSVQPLSFARGLARAAVAAGARVHGHSPVVTLERDGAHWRATTASGAQVLADQVVLATNGYTDALWPDLASTVLAANSFIVATAPLPEHLARQVLPQRETASTSQRLLVYFRKDAQNRLLLGGRGRFSEPQAAPDFAHLERSLALLFPQLKGVPITHRWAGRIAITRDFLPHLHQPAPGLVAVLGCNGRGIALCTSIGVQLAAWLRNPDYAMPYPVSPVRPIPWHGLQRFYISAGVAWYALLDRVAAS